MPKRGGSKGRKKPSLADLSREFLTTDDLVGYINEVHGANPRSMAIMGAAALEQTLVGLLEAQFVDDPDARNELLRALYDSNAMLSTFANKTVLCYLLGLITKEQKDHLDIIRRIRNVFAHRVKPLRFDHVLIKTECERLTLSSFDLGDDCPPDIRFSSCVWRLYDDLAKAAIATGRTSLTVDMLRVRVRP